MATWRAHSFGPASEQPYRRRTSDWIRLVIGVAILVVRHLAPGRPERRSSRTCSRRVNGLPDQLDSFFRLLYALGALWAVGLVVRGRAGGPPLAPRPRPRRSAGCVTWVLARFIGALVVENASAASSLDVVTRIGDDTPALPRGAGRGHRRGHLGRVAVPHPPGAAARAAARAAHRARVALPRHRAARRRARRGRARAGRSRRSCTSRSARPADGPRPRRSRRRSASSASHADDVASRCPSNRAPGP